MKTGWNELPLASICENWDNERVPITKSKRVSGEIPYYGASGIVDYVEGYLFDEKLLLVSEDGANLIARTYPIAFSISGKTWVNNHAHVLKFQNEVTQNWVEYYLNFINLETYISGMAQPKLNQGKLNSIPIPVPPLAEQEEIVEVLDKAFAAIDQAKANIEKNIENAKELFQSKLNQIFSQKGEGWEERKLGEIAHHRLGKMLDKQKNRGTPKSYLRNKNVRWFGFDLEDVLEMKFEKDELTKYTAKKGDVIICEGGYPGRSAIWDFDEPIYFQKAVHRVRFDEPVFNKWLVYLLFHKDFTGELKDHFTGTGIQHFTGKALSKFPILVGPTPVVAELIKQLDALFEFIRAIEFDYQTKLNSLDELKKSILQKAFAGELN